MRKQIILFIFFMSLISNMVVSQNISYDKIYLKNKSKKHIGAWKGEHTGEIGMLILEKSNNAVLVIDNQVLGGEDFEINGVKHNLKYEIDYMKEPIWLDLIIYTQGHQEEEVKRLKGIIRFITDKKIEYRVNFNPADERFKKFDPEDKENTIVLDKVTK